MKGENERAKRKLEDRKICDEENENEGEEKELIRKKRRKMEEKRISDKKKE